MPHRSATSTVELALDLLRGHVPLVVEHRHGLAEAPDTLQPEHVADGLVGSEELAELADAAVVPERVDRLVRAAGVADDEGQARHQERGLPGPVVQLVDRDRGVLEERLPVRPVPDPGAGRLLGDLADDPQPGPLDERGVRGAVAEPAGCPATEAHGVRLAVAVDLDVEPGGQGVDHRRPDAVQAAGGRVGAAAELAPGVQAGHDDLDPGQPGARLDVDRDAAAVVPDLDRAVRAQIDLDPGAVAAQRLVDGVVDDLPQAVDQPPGVGGPDVHARPLADRLQTLQYQEVPGGIGVRLELAVAAGVQGLGHRSRLPAGRRHARAGRLPRHAVMQM